VGSTTSTARQGIAEQYPEREHDDLMSGPHEDVEKENTRLRKEVRLLREEREGLKKAAIRWPVGEWNIHRQASLQAKAPSRACKHALPGSG
jgi:hypothetical protein